MKKFLFVLFCSGVVFKASAQHGHSLVAAYRPPVYVYHSPVVVGLGVGVGMYAPFYAPFGYYGMPYWPLPYGYYPYGGGYYNPSKLQRKEAEIKSDYADRIYSVKQDKSLANKEKRLAIRSLKKQRDQDIQDLRANYHKQPVN